MDLANYIGTFLLKNQFCYIHGLGNLELRRKPASYDGEALQGPRYTVVLTRGGSIDDNLAAFIATGEQTSISKAANALRDFTTDARVDLQAGKTVPLPGIGHFTMQGGGIDFVTDDTLSYAPPSVPVLKSAKRLEDKPIFGSVNAPVASAAPPDTAKPSIAWGKILLVVLLLAGLTAVVIAGLKYLNRADDTSEPAAPRTEDTVAVQQSPAAITAPVADSPANAAPVPAITNGQGGYSIVLNTYATRAQAERRARFLTTTSLGRPEIVAVDSTRFEVRIPYSAALTDSTKVLDSLGRTYGGRMTLSRN